VLDELIPELVALGQVIFIDLVLAGDNAIVVGMAAAGVAREQRSMVIFWGIVAAVVLRVIFALLTTQLLAIIGLTFAGGILLLWVCWKLFRELREQSEEEEGAELVSGDEEVSNGPVVSASKSVGTAIWQVVGPTSPCRWTTCWRWPALRASTSGCWRPAWCCRWR